MTLATDRSEQKRLVNDAPNRKESKMASPRSMWSGAISLGLLTVPCTIGKASSTERETSLLTLCEQHKVPIDRTERCGAGDSDCLLHKVRGVEVGDGEYRVLDPHEYATIEDSTKSDLLTVEDVHPLFDLPMAYGTGTYYLRADKKVKGSEQPFAVLVQALVKTDYGLVVKWCRSARQILAVIHADPDDGKLLLTTIPFANEIREPGDQEYRHADVEVPEQMLDLAVSLLDQTAAESGETFQHDRYADEGLKLRSEAVDRILEGREPAPRKAAPQNVVPDLMAALAASVDASKTTVKQKKSEKQKAK